jgi:hypothetical protein
MLHGKFVATTKVQPITKTQIITIDVNAMDVNVTTKKKQLKNMCSRIENEEQQKMLLTKRKSNS